jgi:uncharacterized membrane protein YqjE
VQVLIEFAIALAVFAVIFVLPAMFGVWRVRREKRRSPEAWSKRRGQLLAEEREWRDAP